MPSVETGDPTAVTNSLVRAIDDASNASPIVITTSVAHLFETGDIVAVTGVGGNTAANGVWQITKTGADTFSLDGSTGNGAYTSGGSVENQSLTPQFQKPSDGDGPIEASDVNPAFEALADRTQFLNQMFSPLATLAQLAAIPAPSERMIRHVIGHGFFVFSAAATTGFFPFRIPADDATPGGWVSSTAHETLKTVVVSLYDMPVTVSGGPDAPSITADIGQIPDSDDLSGNRSRFFLSRAEAGSSTSWHYRLFCDRFMIDGATLLLVTVKFAANASGRGGSLPAVMPQIGMDRVNVEDDGAVPLISGGNGLSADQSANVGEFTATHDILFIPNQNNVIDRALYSYGLVIATEGGTNAIGDDAVLGIEFLFAMQDARRS